MKKLLRRFGFALNGWRLFFKTEQNGQLQAGAGFIATIAGFLFEINTIEWFFILACIAMVLSLEMLNSAMEKLCDHVHPERHFQIKWVKDVSAGAVLIAALVSAIIGCIIFLPKAWQFISNYGTS